MSAQHTPGRLKVGSKVAVAIYTDAGHPVCIVDTMGEIQGDSVDKEFARRLVACWNALEDLPQEALDGGWTRAGLEAYAKRMEAQRDKLLAALERTTEMCEQYADWIKRNVMSADFEQHPYLPELEGAAEDARATIAEVEGAAR